jgi:hypothetical protein
MRPRTHLSPWLTCGLILLLALATWPALAQTTGSIRGTTAEPAGAALPGVTLTLTGENVGERRVITGASGGFYFSALAPGRYSLSAKLDGFREQTLEAVRVSIDGVTTANIAMVPDVFEEQITVSSSVPLLDVSSPSVGASYDEEFIKDLPTRRNFYDIIQTSAGVFSPAEDKFQKFRISAFGANVQSSAWNIDLAALRGPGTDREHCR